MEPWVIEIHDHVLCTGSDQTFWYCSFVNLDGTQCDTVWHSGFPQVPGNGVRIYKRESVKAWIEAGGQIK